MHPAEIALAGAICLTLLALAARSGRADRFFTLHSHEEPTRPYLAYTGAPPVGPWGTSPWAEAPPLIPVFQAGLPRRCSRGI